MCALISRDGKLFVKRDYDAEELEVLGDGKTLAKCIYEDISKKLKEWAYSFDIGDKYYDEFVELCNKLGSLLQD